ncbi:hypothetical protein [Pyruvatibacter mobilis]|uniref:hypothetical protein n=1 Tax=Pyruvatibacter mobilis TaxID=1712261 RepID=UPI003D144BCF
MLVFTFFLIAFFLSTRLISGLLLFLTRSWDGGILRIATAHAACLFVCVWWGVVNLTGNAVGGQTVLVLLFAVPQLIWFGMDVRQTK